ncbi:hypothetical protein MAPG_01259 [Magnaporthiopsis poae ATCC 64411]|uniref:Uncharacterized protein n=1 Tax=Magnaporthiopsis poae (strain ATCC 64411 / 73-15) TaxID=644358 RepID=A0A0C4DN80_MAGP6|nr:hypothetical protein MAPG_01259 [Magnaporthiopsis poae ATCC 64411]
MIRIAGHHDVDVGTANLGSISPRGSAGKRSSARSDSSTKKYHKDLKTTTSSCHYQDKMSPRRRFSISNLSPAKRAENRVMAARDMNQRRSFDSAATASTLGKMPVVEVQQHLPPTIWGRTTVNRV